MSSIIMNQDVAAETITFYQKHSKKNQHVSKCWLTMFKENVDRTPDKPAIMNPSRSALTYAEVERQSNEMARYLKATVEKRNKAELSNLVIASALSRTNVSIAPLLVAVMKMGAALYMVEPQLGDSVNEHRLAKINPDFLITDHENNTLLDVVHDVPHIGMEELLRKMESNDEKSELTWTQEQVVFVASSSGTTGQPKVMRLSLSCCANVAESFHQHVHVRRESRVLQLARKNFDAVQVEFLISLGNGATLVLMDHETTLNPPDFEQFLKSLEVTFMIITPSHINHLIRKSTSLSMMDTIGVVGEVFRIDLARKIAAAGAKRVFNLYGATESGMYNMYALLYDKALSSNIAEPSLGEPAFGTSVRVVRLNESSEALELCTPGQQGELLLSNTLKYVYVDEFNNNTRYATFKDPITGEEACYFKSGDIVNITVDKQLVYVGRKDNQVKIYGQLVVTDEVANQLQQIVSSLFPNQKIQVHISIERDVDGKPTGLHAYHTATDQENAEMIINAAGPALEKVMPQYMVPKEYFWLSEFKMKVGGKLDVEYLTKNGLKSVLRRISGAPLQSEVEHAIAAIWSKLLAIDRIWKREDQFRDFGGDSVLTMAMFANVNEMFGLHLKASNYIGGGESIGNIAVEVELAQICPETSQKDASPLLAYNEVDVLMRLIINPESKYSIYLVHPGETEVYFKILRNMPDEYTVYGLRAPGTKEGEEMAALTVEKYAELFAQRIIKQQREVDKNAINLIGYDRGGILATAIAHIIEEDGYKVQSLTLLDTPNPFNVKANNDTASWITTFFNEMYALNINADDIRSTHLGYSKQFDACFGLAVDKGCVQIILHDSVKEALSNAREQFDETDQSKFARIFFKNSFGLDVDDLLYWQFESYLNRLEYLMKEGKSKNLVPDSLDIMYFVRLLKMTKKLADCVLNYTPRPLMISSGNVRYLYCNPSIDTPMGWYPRFDTWKEYLPQAIVHKFNEFDHFSILEDFEGVESLIDLLRPVME